MRFEEDWTGLRENLLALIIRDDRSEVHLELFLGGVRKSWVSDSHYLLLFLLFLNLTWLAATTSSCALCAFFSLFKRKEINETLTQSFH